MSKEIIYFIIAVILAIPYVLLKIHLRRKFRAQFRDPNSTIRTMDWNRAIISFSCACVVILLIIFTFKLISVKDQVTIDVDKCLQKETFHKKGGEIIETLECHCIVLDKSNSSVAGKETYKVTLELTDEDAKGMQVVDEISKEQYDKLSINDAMSMTRTVHYTLDGLRLYYEDVIDI